MTAWQIITCISQLFFLSAHEVTTSCVAEYGVALKFISLPLRTTFVCAELDHPFTRPSVQAINSTCGTVESV